MKTLVHTYTSHEPMLKVNAFIVETEKALIIVDTTLTMSDSHALKAKAESLGKPLAGIILTHGHPDHVAGTYTIAPKGDVQIYALSSVKKLMQDTESAKHAQWSGVFGSEWIPEWVYPNTVVKNGEIISIAGVRFTVIDIGSGGDCDANSIWLMEGENKAAFIGDFLYNGNHTYMNDGSILRWLANLDRYSPLLKEFDTYYMGHGASGDFSLIAKQRDYFLTYCANVLKATNGSGLFSDETRKQFEETMFALYPDYGCRFMVGLSADAVGRELAGHGH